MSRHGRKLLQAVINELGSMGFDKVFLWVLGKRN